MQTTISAPRKNPPKNTENTTESKLICPACKSTNWFVNARSVRDFEYNAPGEYDWLKCRSCGVIALTPQPTDNILSLAYPNDYHGYHEPSSPLVAWYVEKRKKERARSLAKILPPGGTVLDLGCGDGSLLQQIGKQGDFNLLGVEYQPEAAEKARTRGATVWTGELDDAHIEPESVDLVIMEHVIEHVPAPSDTLARVFSILKPGGILLGETPNTDCPDAKLFGRYWGGGHAPRHMFLFNPPSMTRILTDSGFFEVKISHPMYPAHLALSVQNYLRRNRTDTAGLKRGRTWYYSIVCSVMIPIAIIAQKFKCSGAIQYAAKKHCDMVMLPGLSSHTSNLTS